VNPRLYERRRRSLCRRPCTGNAGQRRAYTGMSSTWISAASQYAQVARVAGQYVVDRRYLHSGEQRETSACRPRPPSQIWATTPPLVTGGRPASRSRLIRAATSRSPRPAARNAPASKTGIRPPPVRHPPAPKATSSRARPRSLAATLTVLKPAAGNYRPWKRGSRLSMKAWAASRWSSVSAVCTWCVTSRSMQSASSPPAARFRFSFM
jgi:hypothetical protein